jgi:hypothetical protein
MHETFKEFRERMAPPSQEPYIPAKTVAEPDVWFWAYMVAWGTVPLLWVLQ